MNRPTIPSARALAAAVTVLLIAAGCGGSAGSPTASGDPAGASGATIQGRTTGSAGAVLVASANGMSVYTFAKDTPNSGRSACTGDCIATWPAVTVPAGSTPAAGSGVSGALGTITRSDSGALQVTYDGLPLYFFSGDRAPGDLNGVYTDWAAARP